MKTRLRTVIQVFVVLMAITILITDREANASDMIVASGNCTDTVRWILDSKGTLTIEGSGEMGIIGWYDYRDDIKSIIIEDGITTISEHAFMNCEKLTNIEMSSSIKEIQSYAMYNTAIDKIDIPYGVEKIDQCAFSRTKLEEVYIPNSVTDISNEAFASCYSLKKITLPNNLKIISKRTFSYCTALSTITLGKNIQKISMEAFNECTGLQNIRFLGNSPQIAYQAFKNVNATINYSARDFTWITEVLQDYGGTIVWRADDSIPVYQDFEDVQTNTYYYKPVKWAYTNKITVGTSKNTFSPDKECTRAEAIQLLFRAYKGDASDGDIPFIDVSRDDWFYSAVEWAYRENIARGTSENRFAPEKICTRAEIIQLIWASEGKPEPKSTGTFSDVKSTDWYYKAVCWAQENKIASGYSKTRFSPNSACTRAHIVTFLYNGFKDDVI